uniref:Large ribosomal subunit protein bL27c n=1 Tax=Caulacanthus okamurae TaxID=152008 RepID=A0A6H1UA82_9FLOR|nr:50S ribosomal protein L27 [Caulacanthus okamurae]QIZ74589.1 50S ribosomal protein L27 [Caulacanthus okamurae]
MAHKKGSGSTKNGRDSNSKRLGIKKYGGEHVTAGNIIVRQRGSTFKAGNYTKIGKDYTIFAIHEGTVKFQIKNKRNKKVHVIPNTLTTL